jgi:hypothetical protein
MAGSAVQRTLSGPFNAEVVFSFTLVARNTREVESGLGGEDFSSGFSVTGEVGSGAAGVDVAAVGDAVGIGGSSLGDTLGGGSGDDGRSPGTGNGLSVAKPEKGGVGAM